MNVSQLARAHGLSFATVWQRLQAGWSVEAAAETPVGSRRRALHEKHDERDAFAAAFAVDSQLWTQIEREAVKSVFLEGRSVAAAAANLAVNVGTLTGRIQTARATLRRWLLREAQAAGTS